MAEDIDAIARDKSGKAALRVTSVQGTSCCGTAG